MTDDQRLQLAALQLAPILALDVGLRGLAITPDRVQGGGSDHDPREALSDAGTLRRAREVSARLAGLPRAPAGVLRWIAANAHGLGIAEASERYGRTEGPIALEPHVEDPKSSAVFAEYPRLLADHTLVNLIADTLRLVVVSSGTLDVHAVEDVMDNMIKTHHHEVEGPQGTIATLADALPALRQRFLKSWITDCGSSDSTLGWWRGRCEHS